jgi:DNA-directed RNA polymerase subunit M/transcription elongation factor TFIIS
MSMFMCSGCGDELIDHAKVEEGDGVVCDKCGVEYDIGIDEHPSFDVTLNRRK